MANKTLSYGFIEEKISYGFESSCINVPVTSISQCSQKGRTHKLRDGGVEMAVAPFTISPLYIIIISALYCVTEVMRG